MRQSDSRPGDSHVAAYIPSSSAPNLVRTLCSCGRSSFGASLPESAEAAHDRHVLNPTNGTYREPTPTEHLFNTYLSAISAPAPSPKEASS